MLCSVRQQTMARPPFVLVLVAAIALTTFIVSGVPIHDDPAPPFQFIKQPGDPGVQLVQGALCANDTYMFGASWCYFHNGLRVPYIFNYSTDIVPGASEWTCDGVLSKPGPYDQCTMYNQMNYVDLVSDNGAHAMRLLVAATQSRSILFFELNHEYLQNVTLEGKLTHSVDILSIQHHQGNKSFVFWGNKEDRRIFLSVMELSNSGNLFVETLAELQLPHVVEVISVSPLVLDGQDSLVQVSVLITAGLFQTFIYDPTQPFSSPINPEPISTISSTNFQGPMQVSSFEQGFGFTPGINKRLFVMISDTKRVHILEYTRQAALTVDFGNPNASTLYYDALNSTITTIAAIPEKVGVRTFWDQPSRMRVRLWGQYVWILMGTGKGADFKLRLILLPEFGWAKWTNGTFNYEEYTNYCGSPAAGYYDPVEHKCLPHPTTDFASPIKPTHIDVRFFENFMGDLSRAVLLPHNSTLPMINIEMMGIFITFGRYLVIFGLQPDLNSRTKVMVDKLNEFAMVGNIQHMALSINAQHLSVSVQRRRWELDSMTRFADICDRIKAGHLSKVEQASLEPFAFQCRENYRRPGGNDFHQYVGMCPMGVWCYSLVDPLFLPLEPGYYTINSFQKHVCDPGHFCFMGMRLDCPPGFICPNTKTYLPQVCTLTPGYNTSCYGQRLTAPYECPPGAICVAPYMPPLPAPPGYAARDSSSRQRLVLCQPGEYCNLGRSQGEDRRCPANTYCPTTSNMAPTVCTVRPEDNYSAYCPPGSTRDIACPAGYFCEGPSSIGNCTITQYCEAGTISPVPCPAGYYCPTPNERIECPESHYCVTGSVEPQACPPLVSCPAGTAKIVRTYAVLVGCITIIVVVIVVWKGSQYLYKRKQKKAQSIRFKGDESMSLINKLGDSMEEYIPMELQPKGYTVEFDFKDMGLVLKKGFCGRARGKKVLDGVSGCIQPGRLTAVMGPSGAGKSSFLTTLAGKAYYGALTGHVYLNGEPRSISEFKKIVGFVPQEDIMLRSMTVEEVLLTSALLRLPTSWTYMEKKRMVNSIIDLMGLQDVRDSRIGDETKRGISGGQRKRVNIGMELVADPTILFLDEPTSGLDSSSSREVCGLLRKVAQLGLTVVTVIHQPRYEIFTMFHDVLLLGKGGRTVYIGPSERALEYFESMGFPLPDAVNPPDFFMDIIAGSVEPKTDPLGYWRETDFTPELLFDVWESRAAEYSKTSAFDSSVVEADKAAAINRTDLAASLFEDGEDSDRPLPPVVLKSREKQATSRSTAGFFTQSLLFTVRAFIQQTRDLQGIIIDLALLILAGGFLGLVFFNYKYIGPPPAAVCDSIAIEALRKRCLMPIDDPISTIASLTSMSMSLIAVAGSLRVFGLEKVNFWRENSSGAYSLSYFLGKDIAHLPNMLLYPLLFISLFASLAMPRAAFAELYIIFFLIYYCGTGIGYLVSVVVPPSISQLCAVVSILVCMMFSGARPTLNELSSMFFPLPIIPNISFLRWAQEAVYLAEIKKWANVYDIHTGLDVMGYTMDHEILSILLLLVIGFSFRLLAFLSLELLDRGKRK